MQESIVTGKKIAPELEVVKIDTGTLKVFVRSSAEALEDKIYQLNSEDARILAIQAACKAGLSGAMLKHAAVYYGDDVKCEPARNFESSVVMNPFLIVEVYSEAISTMQPIGDSFLGNRVGM